MWGSIEITHTAATPQKKNKNPFWARPVSSVPRTPSATNRTSAAAASTRSLTGSGQPSAPNRVRR